MRNFEDQLRDSAARMRKRAALRSLSLPKNPFRRQPRRWMWSAVAVAAVLGWVVGVTMPPRRSVPHAVERVAVRQWKRQPRVADTVYLPQKAEPSVARVQTVVVPSAVASDGKAPARHPVGKNICNDGVDYSLLVALP